MTDAVPVQLYHTPLEAKAAARYFQGEVYRFSHREFCIVQHDCTAAFLDILLETGDWFRISQHEAVRRNFERVL